MQLHFIVDDHLMIYIYNYKPYYLYDLYRIKISLSRNNLVPVKYNNQYL